MILPTLKNKYVLMETLDDILLVSYKSRTVIDLKAAKEILQYRIWFQQGQSYPVLCDIRKIRSMTKPAREYLTYEGLVLVERLAIVMDHGLTTFLTEVHGKSNWYGVPAAKFSSIHEALMYLKPPQETLTWRGPGYREHDQAHTNEKV